MNLLVPKYNLSRLKLDTILLKATLPLLCLVFSWRSNAQDFEEVAQDIGVEHFSFHDNRMCSGIGLFDFNNDGFVDIFTTGGEAEDHFFKNINGQYVDITDSVGIGLPAEVVTCGVGVGDYDKDGFDDLFITTEQGWHNYLFRNNGDETFTDVTEEVGIILDDTVWSTSVTFVDINVDGYLDIYVSNYVEYRTAPHSRSITNNSQRPIRQNYMYIGSREGTFTEKSLDLNINTRRATLAVTAADINGDYLPDLFDANDFGRLFGPNSVLLNDIPNSDSMYYAAKELNLEDRIDGMGVAVGDIDGDLTLDFHYTDWLHDILKVNQFSDCTPFKLVTQGRKSGVCWGTSFLDYDNDSDLDVLTAFGNINGNTKLTTGFIKNYGWDRIQDRSEEVGFTKETYGRGTAIADFDNDGDMDVFITNVNHEEGALDYLEVYRNVTDNDNNWLNIYLEGVDSNPRGYDATIYLHAGDKTFLNYMDGGSSYLSFSEPVVHFGLRGMTTIDSLVIVWAGGKRQVEKGLEVNQTYTIREKTTGLQQSTIAMDYGCFIEGEPGQNIGGEEEQEEDVVLNVKTDKGPFLLYPNPVQKVLNLDGVEKGIYTVYDLKGGSFFSVEALGDRHMTIDVSALEKGVYIMRSLTLDGTKEYKFFKN